MEEVGFTLSMKELREKLNKLQAMEFKYETPHPPWKDSRIWRCPHCDGRVRPVWNHCHKCGKRLDWGNC